MGVQGYDGMAAIAHVVTTLKGKIDPDAAINALRGWKYNSPRGPISIDPRTRDIVMNEYLSEIVKKDGRLVPEEHRRHHRGQGHVQGAGRRALQAIAKRP